MLQSWSAVFLWSGREWTIYASWCNLKSIFEDIDLGAVYVSNFLTTVFCFKFFICWCSICQNGIICIFMVSLTSGCEDTDLGSWICKHFFFKFCFVFSFSFDAVTLVIACMLFVERAVTCIFYGLLCNIFLRILTLELYMLTAHNWQKWKVHSSHETTMKFIGKKRMV